MVAEPSRPATIAARIDAFTDMHPVLSEARGALPAPLRRYAGILMDVYFDHLLIIKSQDCSHATCADWHC